MLLIKSTIVSPIYTWISGIDDEWGSFGPRFELAPRDWPEHFRSATQPPSSNLQSRNHTPRRHSTPTSPVHCASSPFVTEPKYSQHHVVVDAVFGRSGLARYVLSQSSQEQYGSSKQARIANDCAAKPSSLIVPYKAVASISSSAPKPAQEVAQRQDVMGRPLSVTGKIKREEPLASQIPKKGAMQYALYVFTSRHHYKTKNNRIGRIGANSCTAQPSTKSPTGHANPPSGP